MAKCVCTTYRLPDNLQDLKDAIEDIDDSKFLSLVISYPDSVGKMYAVLVSKT